MTKKNYLVIVMLSCLFFVACANKQTNEVQQAKKSATTQTVTKQTATPTLFIHGYGGGYGSFGSMLHRLEKKKATKNELVLTVSGTGDIEAKGALTGKKDNPSIQVIFEENKNNEWNQAEWIKNCLAFIHENYQINQVNLVGHSMGGVSSLRYMTTFGQTTGLPKINKFIGIGAPFNNLIDLSTSETVNTVLANGPQEKSDRYNDFTNGINQIDSTMKVLLIAGDLQDGSGTDSIVPVTDALSVVYLFRNHGNKVTEKIIYGKKAQHSQLHENAQVDELVRTFLWGTNE